jgi:uncharacterized protein (DUF1778 family)
MKIQHKRNEDALKRVIKTLDLPDYRTNELERTAKHEASHLVIAKLLGEWIKGVGLGGPDSLDGAGTWTRLRSRDVYSLRNRLCVLWAGPISDGNPLPPIGSGELGDDEKQLIDIAREIHGKAGSQQRIDAEINRAKTRAEKLVQEHRAKIEELAEHLIKLYECIDRIRPV